MIPARARDTSCRLATDDNVSSIGGLVDPQIPRTAQTRKSIIDAGRRRRPPPARRDALGGMELDAASAILPGAGPADWKVLREEASVTDYHAATVPLTLYRGETEAYRVALSETAAVGLRGAAAGEGRDVRASRAPRHRLAARGAALSRKAATRSSRG